MWNELHTVIKLYKKVNIFNNNLKIIILHVNYCFHVCIFLFLSLYSLFYMCIGIMLVIFNFHVLEHISNWILAL